MSKLRRTLSLARLLPCFAAFAALSSCAAPIDEASFLRAWTLPDGSTRPLRVEVERDASGELVSVELHGLLPLYREAPGPDGPIPLPAWRDLLLDVQARLDARALGEASTALVRWRFHKVSPRILGPRTSHEPTLSLSIDGVPHEVSTRTRTGSSSRYWAEWQEVDLPLGTVLDIGRAGSFEGRLSSLSPFELAPADAETLRALDTLLLENGIDTASLPRLPPAPEVDPDAWAGPGGSIWGLVWSPETPTRQSRIVQVSSYSGPVPARRTLRPTSWIRLPPAGTRPPGVVRLEGREGDAPLGAPHPDRADELLASRLASIVVEVLRDEFGLAAAPDLWVLVFPVPERAAWRLVVQTPLDRGVAFGVPSISGRIADADASTLLWLMAHEYAEGLLILPYLGPGAALYRSSDRHRWLGDGVAELVAALAFQRARDAGIELPAPGSDVDWLLEELERGARAIALSDWTTVDTTAAVREGGAPEPRPRETADDNAAEIDDKSRYLAAEHLCARWYAAARSRGHDRPLAELLAWLTRFPAGPPEDALLDWLSQTSGFDLRAELLGVRLEAMLRYHVEKWRSLGWALPAGTTTLGP